MTFDLSSYWLVLAQLDGPYPFPGLSNHPGLSDRMSKHVASHAAQSKDLSDATFHPFHADPTDDTVVQSVEGDLFRASSWRLARVR